MRGPAGSILSFLKSLDSRTQFCSHHPRRKEEGNMRKLKSFAVLLVFAAVTQHVAQAGAVTSTPALSFTGGALLGPMAGTYGWTFTVSTPVVVDNLGYFDFGGNGLSVAHDVGIWDSSGTLLDSATVPAGTAGSLQDGFRYTAAPALLLPIGIYTIGGFDPESADAITLGAIITTAPGITYGASRSIGGASLTFPTGDVHANGNSYFGPNFTFVAVPEPATSALLLLGGMAACLARRRHRS
jgi:hypothetical protein